MKKTLALLLACVLALSCAGMMFVSAEETLPEGALEFQLSHVNCYSWGTFFDMVAYGEGRNCHNMKTGDHGCEWWIAIKVDNVDGVYTVTQIEGNGEAKTMAASADGFVMYLFSDNGNCPTNFENAQKVQVGDIVYSHTFDWTVDCASESALGNIVLAPAGTELPSVDEPSEEPSEEPAGDTVAHGMVPSGMNPMDYNFQAWGSDSTVMTMEEIDGSFVFKTDKAGWPSIDVLYDPIVVDVENSKINIDFTVTGGETKILIWYKNAAGEQKGHYLSGDALPGSNYSTSTGNNPDGNYKGEYSLADFLATADYTGHVMSDAVVDGKVSILGFQIFVVSGAEVAINALEIVETVPAETPSEGPSEGPGDAGVLVFAVLGVVAAAGCAVAVKARREI